MKRKLKFRAYSRVNGRMMQWKDIKKFGNLNKLLTLNHVTVMQFTGLVDKNGQDIYEGDYLVERCPVDEDDSTKGYIESLFPVVWCDNHLVWCIDASFEKDGGYLLPLVQYFGEHKPEVKGNIYQTKQSNK